MNDPRIIVALHYPDEKEILDVAARLDPSRCRLKVGKIVFTVAGSGVATRLVTAGFGVFLDLKHHDIPNTVGAACRVAADLRVWMLDVHALGGRRMMAAAAEAVQSSSQRPLLVAVTVLTSFDAHELSSTGWTGSPVENVMRLARLAVDAGLDGLACSPEDLNPLRRLYSPELLLVTPGIRPLGANRGDQQRVMTPTEAMREAASYLVIGRPITAAGDPMHAPMNIEAEISDSQRFPTEHLTQ